MFKLLSFFYIYAEKDRNSVRWSKKEQERRSGEFRLETNPGFPSSR